MAVEDISSTKNPLQGVTPLQLTPCHPFFASNPGFISPRYSVLVLLDLLASYKKLYSLKGENLALKTTSTWTPSFFLGCAEELLWKLSWKGEPPRDSRLEDVNLTGLCAYRLGQCCKPKTNRSVAVPDSGAKLLRQQIKYLMPLKTQPHLHGHSKGIERGSQKSLQSKYRQLNLLHCALASGRDPGMDNVSPRNRQINWSGTRN